MLEHTGHNCTGCNKPVYRDPDTGFYHCGPCIRLGERVEWTGPSEVKRKLTGTVVGFAPSSFDLGDRVVVEWDHRPGQERSAPMDFVRHLSVLDRLADI
jgi:hypothetical protein